MDILDLEGQTAPESTRGLFDPPPPPPASAADVRALSQNEYDVSDAEQQRAKVLSGYPFNNSNRPSSFHPRSSLHTVNEEDSPEPFYKRQSSRRESLSLERKHRSSSVFNSLPIGTVSRRSSTGSRFPTMTGYPEVELDEEEEGLSREDALAMAEAKLTGAAYGVSTSIHRARRPNGDLYYGTTSDYGLGDEFIFKQQQQQQQQQQKPNRRLSEPGTRGYCYRYPDMDQLDHQRRSLNQQQQNRRTSVHWPYEDNNADYDLEGYLPRKTGNNSKAQSLTVDVAKSRRSSLRNDWRSSTSSLVSSTTTPAAVRSPTSNNRSSYVWVPFTPTRVSFPREDGAATQQQQQQRRALFTAHLPFSALVPLLKSHQLVSGILRVNKRNRSDAYVFCEEFNADIYICGSRDRNRALEGDVVAVKLVEVDKVMKEKHEKEQAKIIRNNGQPIIRKPDEEDEKEIMFGGEEDVDKVKPKYCGVVVAILERAQNQAFSGTLGLTRPSNKRSKSNDTDQGSVENNGELSNNSKDTSSPRIVWFKPTDKRVPLIAIPVEQAPPGFIENSEQFANRLFLGSIKRWPITSLHPFGVLETELGNVDDLSVQFRAILADNNFAIEPFSDALIRCLPSLPWTPAEESIATRRDLRGIRSITISRTGDGDLENALSINKVPGSSTFEVGFHVADISAFVKPHSPLDKEGKARAAAVYLCESAPLWPEQLLHECTDLMPGMDRFAFSVLWTMNIDGEVLDTWYGKTVIKSRGILSTAQLQDILDGVGMPSHLEIPDQDKPGWEDDIRMLYTLAQNLKQARRNLGAMFLREPSVEIELDHHGQPTNISTKIRVAADDILDEFEILLNKGVAQKISSHFPEHALLLSQPPPNERKLRELASYLRGLGYKIDPSTAGTLQQTIEAIENESARTVITTLALKTMYPPKFFCIGRFDISRYYHYSLNAPLYTQFTSPSRRYADLIVHRQLEAALTGGERRFYLETDLIQKIARHCNVKGQAAQNAREQSLHLFLSRYLALSGQTATTHEAIVVGVQEQAFDVIVPGLNLQRRIHVINLPLETHKYSEKDGVLHLFWKQGVATADAMAEQADALYDEDSVDDDDEEDLVDLSPTPTSAPPSTTTTKNNYMPDNTAHRLSVSSPPSAEQQSTMAATFNNNKRRPRSMSLRAIEGENPWISQQECTIPDECRQVIRSFDYIRVVITSDPNRSPPLIRVLAANPFV